MDNEEKEVGQEGDSDEDVMKPLVDWNRVWHDAMSHAHEGRYKEREEEELDALLMGARSDASLANSGAGDGGIAPRRLRRGKSKRKRQSTNTKNAHASNTDSGSDSDNLTVSSSDEEYLEAGWEVIYEYDADEEWELLDGADVEDNWDMVPEADRFLGAKREVTIEARMRGFLGEERRKREREKGRKEDGAGLSGGNVVGEGGLF